MASTERDESAMPLLASADAPLQTPHQAAAHDVTEDESAAGDMFHMYDGTTDDDDLMEAIAGRRSPSSYQRASGGAGGGAAYSPPVSSEARPVPPTYGATSPRRAVLPPGSPSRSGFGGRRGGGGMSSGVRVGAFEGADWVPGVRGRGGRVGGRAVVEVQDPLVKKRSRVLPVAVVLVLAVMFHEVQLWVRLVNDARYRYVVAQMGLFLIVSAAYMTMRREHKRIQFMGYLEFYTRGNALLRFIYFLSAFCVAAISTVFVLFDGHDDDIRDDVMDAVASVVNLILLGALMLYAVVTHRHNESKSLPDAQTLDDLPSSLNNPSGSGASSGPLRPNSLIKKQANLIKLLEDRVRSLNQELIRVRQQNAMRDQLAPSGGDGDFFPRAGSSAPANNRGGFFGRNAPSNLSSSQQSGTVAALEQDNQALRTERDRLYAEREKLNKELNEMRMLNDAITEENSGLITRLEAQQQEVARTTDELSRLMVLFEVSREANSVSRQTIEQYEQNRGGT